MGIGAGYTGGGPSPGGHALHAWDSRVAVHDCVLIGGRGGDDDVGEGYDGGDGARLLGGWLLASGSSFTGGDGGRGGEEDGCVPFGNHAGDGGDGGDGLSLLHDLVQAFVPDAAKKGVLRLGGVPQVLHVGTLDASGVLTRSWALPPPPPGFEGATVQLQAWMASPSTGLHLTGDAPVVVLEPSL